MVFWEIYSASSVAPVFGVVIQNNSDSGKIDCPHERVLMLSHPTLATINSPAL